MTKAVYALLFFIHLSAWGAPQDYSIHIKKIIEANIKNKKAALDLPESSNQEHMLQLISPMDQSIVKSLIKLGFNFDAYWGGIVDSDLGKMKVLQGQKAL